MSGKHLFEFVNTISEDLSSLMEDIEASLFSQPQSVLIQARLYTENLMKIVSKHEELEKVAPIKHSERIYRLYRQNAVEEEIYVKLEWLRKKGNKAAHDIHAATYEDGFKAHRYLFDISVWYVQVYVNYDFEAPIYKLPDPKQNESGLSEEKVKELVQPFVEQSFHQMDEMKKELQNQLNEIKKERAALSKSEEVDREKEGQKKNPQEKFSLFKYLDEEGIEYVDKRDKNGTLWIIGDWSIKDKLFALKPHNIYFRFAKKGSRSTNNKPAWFLLNKNLEEKPGDYKRWLEEETKEEGVEDYIEKAGNKKESFSISLVALDESDWVSKGQMRLPSHLEGVSLHQTADPALSNFKDCHTFADVTEEKLREIYKLSKEAFLDTVEALFFWGIRFTGKLASFQPAVGQGSCEHVLRVHNPGTKKIKEIAPVREANRLEDKNIVYVKSLDKLLLNSLNWLTGSENTWVKEWQGDHVEETPVPKENTTLYYKMEKIDIPAVIAEKSLWRIGVEGCDNVLRQFNRLGVMKLGDIDFPLDNVHEKMNHTGEKTVAKFWNQLQQVVGKKQELNTVDDKGNKVIYFNKEKLNIPEDVVNEELNQQSFPGAEQAVAKMKESGVMTLGDLPYDLTKIREIKGVGNKKVEMIFERLSSFIQEIERNKELEKLSPEEYKNHLFQKLFKRIENATKYAEEAKKERIQPRYFSLIEKRYYASLKGEHVTLEEMGSELGVTRERIRQVLAKGDERIAALVQPFLDSALKDEQQYTGLFKEDLLNPQSFLHFVVFQGIEKLGFSIVTSHDEVYISTLDMHEIREMEGEISSEVKDTFHLRIIRSEELTGYCEEKAVEIEWSPDFIKGVAEREINWLANDQGILKSASKRDVVEMVMLQYPDGVDVYGREEELIDKANDFMPGQFNGERSFNSVAMRDDSASPILLWNRSVYIHEKFITASQSFLDRANQLATELVEDNGPVHVAKVYEAFEDEMTEQNIISEYGLYALMRKYASEGLSLDKFPLIHPSDMERQSNGEYVRKFIADNGGKASVAELQHNFLNNKGWRKFSLEQALNGNRDIIVLNHAEYGLLSDYDHIKSEDLQFVTDQIIDKLKETPVTFIDSFYHDNELVLRSLGITSRRLLYSLMKDKFGGVLKMGRFPYILKEDVEMNEVFSKKLIEDYIKQEEDIVSREEVEQWIADMLGESNRYLDVVLSHTDSILYYTRGKYGEYIHSDNVGYGESMKEQLDKSVQELFEKVSEMKNREYVFINELIDEDFLPSLKNHIEWSEDLLSHLLKKSENWNVIGSYDAIITPVNSTISSEVEFIEYLLREEFSGAAKLRSLKKYLNDIRYSSEGKLLKEVEIALEEEYAPFQLDGDDILLIDWSDVKL